MHISMLAHQFVKDPRDVVKAGDIVRVKVMEVDIPAPAYQSEYAYG